MKMSSVEDLEKNATASNTGGGTALSEEDSQSLRKWNIGAAALQGITGIIIMFITNKDATAPSYTNFPNDLRGKPTLWGPMPKKRHDVQLGYFSGVFLLLSCLNHLYSCTIGRHVYESYLKRSMNPIRWFEYSFSASLMRILIAMLSGIFDITLLIAIYGLTMTTMIFGYLQEATNSQYQGAPHKKSLASFWLGCVPHLYAWGIVCYYFFYAVSTGDPPAFVWAIIFIQLILDSTFAINMYVQQTEYKKFANYLHGEKAFILLSFTAKQLLAWLNYGGTQSLKNEA